MVQADANLSAVTLLPSPSVWLATPKLRAERSDPEGVRVALGCFVAFGLLATYS